MIAKLQELAARPERIRPFLNREIRCRRDGRQREPWLTIAAVLSLFGAGFLLDSSSQPGERRTEHVAHLVLLLWAAAAIAPCRYCV